MFDLIVQSYGCVVTSNAQLKLATEAQIAAEKSSHMSCPDITLIPTVSHEISILF